MGDDQVILFIITVDKHHSTWWWEESRGHHLNMMLHWIQKLQPPLVIKSMGQLLFDYHHYKGSSITNSTLMTKLVILMIELTLGPWPPPSLCIQPQFTPYWFFSLHIWYIVKDYPDNMIRKSIVVIFSWEIPLSNLTYLFIYLFLFFGRRGGWGGGVALVISYNHLVKYKANETLCIFHIYWTSNIMFFEIYMHWRMIL